MLTKITTFAVMTLMSTASAAITPTETVTGTAAAPTGNLLFITDTAVATGETYASNGYACIRRGFFYVYPMVIKSDTLIENAIISTTIRAFYPILVA